MKDKISVPIMPFLVDNSWDKKTLLIDTIFSSAGALRLVALTFVIGSLSPILAIPWQSTTEIFNWIYIPILANVGFIAFTERKLRNQMTNGEWIHYIAIMSSGVISIEFAGILAHTATIFMQNPSTAAFWDQVSIMLFGGSFGMSLFQSYTKRFIGIQMDDRAKMFFIVLIVPLLAALCWTIYSKILPMTSFHF